jgi:hypothetical protein
LEDGEKEAKKDKMAKNSRCKKKMEEEENKEN